MVIREISLYTSVLFNKSHIMSLLSLIMGSEQIIKKITDMLLKYQWHFSQN